MLDVCLLGTGGMMPLPYRWLTSLLVRYNGSSLLIDCGEGTQIAIKEKGWSFKPIDVICFTHYHGDHISGLPGLLLTMGNADRTEPLTLIGPKGLERVVNSLRVIAPELPFQIKYIEITQPEQIFEMNGYRLKAFRVNHNVTCYGYTMEIDRAGKFDVDRANEAAIPQKFWGSLQKGENVHISGLPGLLLTMGNADRTEPLTLIGPKGLERVVNSLRVIAPELPFQIKYIEITQPEQIFEMNGYRLKAFRVNHNVTCYGYTMEIDRAGKFDVDRANEAAIPQKFWGSLQKGENVQDGDNLYTPDMVLGPARKGIKLTYCTDTRPTDSIRNNAKGSDLFICEGMYGEKDKLKKAKEYKHMTFYEAAQLAKEAEVAEMWLTHYSPSLTHPEEYMDEVKKIFPNSIAAKDKRTVELTFSD